MEQQSRGRLAISTVVRARHFAASVKIPRISEDDILQETFKKLSDAHAGGFVLISGETGRSFVIAQDLAHAVSKVATKTSWKNVSQMRLGTFIAYPGLSIPHIPITHESLLADADVLSLVRGRRVLYPVQENGKYIGWFFDAEEHKAAVDTPPPTFICGNPKHPHSNPDPDSGFCYRCRYPIVRTS
jgi:hypothetical protein